MQRYALAFMMTLIQIGLSAQTLEELLASEAVPPTQYVYSTFQSTRLINGHTIEKMPENELDFRVSHRFGALNGGIYDFFGLDYAQTHLSLEYGINRWLMVGIGRSSFEKTADGFAKLSLLRQTSGERSVPFHLSLILSAEAYGLKPFDGIERDLSSRMTYVQQLLIARKFSPGFSFQLMPTHIYRNLPPSPDEAHALFALGIGASGSISPRMAVNIEYYPVIREETAFLGSRYRNPLSIGLDIETGGHVFQLLLSNARSLREGSFIGRTTGDWMNGDIHFGFNISRVFSFN